MGIKREKIKVYEMTCTSCENRVEKAIKKINGVLDAKASFSDQSAEVEYDDEQCSLSEIKAAINNAGYSTQSSNDYRFMGILIIAAGIIFLGLKTSGFDMEEKLANATYAALFLVGVLTSIHCVGMCGGIMLSQSLSGESKNRFEAIQPALLYNLGRVTAYTIFGGIIGGLGSVISLSIVSKAAIQIFAGVFMILMGLNMAGFSAFRKFHIKLPGFACKTKNKSRSPLIVGLLNGFMPCGPLQTMQLFALGTGSPIKGGLSMFMFAIGTVPLMLTFGALSGLLSKGYTKKILKLSGVLVIILGLIMGNRGLALAGINTNPMTIFASSPEDSLNTSDGSSNPNIAKATMEDGYQIINMTANNYGYTPNVFYVQKGVPVKWVIDGQQLNSCNNAIVARELNLEWKLNKGENVKEFIPGDKDINFSCWMGMIRGVIKVVDKLDTVDTSQSDPSLPPPSTGSSCCGTPYYEESDITEQPSIYGNDLSQVPIEKLVNKAKDDGDYQIAKFKGIGYELEPLIVVTGKSKKTKLILDLSNFDNPEGEYYIFDWSTAEDIMTFTGREGINEVEFAPQKTDGYIIIKDDYVLGVIEVVDDLNTADPQKVLNKYFP